MTPSVIFMGHGPCIKFTQAFWIAAATKKACLCSNSSIGGKFEACA